MRKNGFGLNSSAEEQVSLQSQLPEKNFFKKKKCQAKQRCVIQMWAAGSLANDDCLTCCVNLASSHLTVVEQIIA